MKQIIQITLSKIHVDLFIQMETVTILQTTFSIVFPWMFNYWMLFYVDGLVQERRNSIANALELRLFLH